MPSNFRLLVHPNSENLHIKLIGDFDASAATALLESLQKHRPHFKRIFIHTSCLNTIKTAAAKSFQHRYNLPYEDIDDIVFTGEHAGHIAPHAWQVL